MQVPWIEGIVKKWSLDNPDEELYELLIHNEKTVISTYGRFAHSSGSYKVTWQEFMAGKLDELVLKTMGAKTLQEAKEFIRKHGI